MYCHNLNYFLTLLKMQPQTVQRSRSVCFTLNNYTEEEVGQVKSYLQSDDVKFGGFGKETGEEGTPHLQGFICFKNPKTYSALKNIPGFSRMHFESMKGTVDQNITYCSKQGDYEEYGVKPQQGKRSDLDEVVALVESGKRVRDVALECPIQFVKFHKGIERLIGLQAPVRHWKTEVYWFWGSTGTGKSKRAYEMAEQSSYYVKDPTNKWWCGYEQQDVVIIDDYRRDFCTFASLLRLMDRYPMTVEWKGTTTQFASKVLIITTPKNPTQTWEGRTEEEIGQLTRRIDHIEHFATLASFMR